MTLTEIREMAKTSLTEKELRELQKEALDQLKIMLQREIKQLQLTILSHEITSELDEVEHFLSKHKEPVEHKSTNLETTPMAKKSVRFKEENETLEFHKQLPVNMLRPR
ncbi:MAG: hypothetical protein AB7I18_09070 [Candidatus Berkiella sp.]